MSQGIIKRLTDKGFGFIDTGSDKDMFFHTSNQRARFEKSNDRRDLLSTSKEFAI